MCKFDVQLRRGVGRADREGIGAQGYAADRSGLDPFRQRAGTASTTVADGAVR
jgi:hypothetical protein